MVLEMYAPIFAFVVLKNTVDAYAYGQLSVNEKKKNNYKQII